MAETVESFVAKLHEEGVEAGRKEADRLRAEAEENAKQVVQQARQEADKLLADAKAEAEKTLARAGTELELAARDAALRLQDSLSRCLSALLTREVGEKLSGDEFLGKLLHEIVLQYVKDDFEHKEVLEIHVRPEMREKLISWALLEIGKETIDQVRPSIDLKGTLADAGFEYTHHGSTIEVTRDSVVETLMDLVGPGLRDVLAKAMADPADGGKAAQE